MTTRVSATVCGVVAAWAGAVMGSPVPVNGFADIGFWAGSGTNASAFVLQFGTSSAPTSVAWGYRWNGAATVADMIFSLTGQITVTGGSPLPAGSDPRLAVDATYYDYGPEFVGYFLTEIRYDQTGLPQGWDQTVRTIANQYTLNGTYPALYAAPAAGGGWTGAGDPPAMQFTFSENEGISDLDLAPGGWYGFVQGTGTATFDFSQPVAAVPEPSGLLLLAGGAVVAMTARIGCRCRRTLTRSGVHGSDRPG